MEHTFYGLCLSIFALNLLATSATAAEGDDGFVSIFDGKTLNQWDGNPKLWSVRDGAMTGQTTPDKPTKSNTFIIWRGGETTDFELKLQYKIIGGNSGIQYRSFEVKNEKWVVGGYQADFEAGARYSGINYGERFRGILADRGQKATITKEGKKEVLEQLGDAKELQKHIKNEDWNDYHIIAKGNHFIHKINGVTMSEFVDNDEKGRAKGVLALQLHAGPPMTVQFRKIRLKSTSAEKNAASSAPKPVFSSKVVSAITPNHSVSIEADITGAKQLFLVVRDGGNGYGCDWADWAEPRLVGPNGEKKLTELKWNFAAADWGQVRVGKNAGGGDLRIGGKPVDYGIGTHSISVIAFDLPQGFTHFKARGGLDNGGTDQSACGQSASVQFQVYTSNPGSVTGGTPHRGNREPEDAIEGLDVAHGLEATLFASEPGLLSPTNIDIDPLGRVWVCEVQNYRHRQGTRSDGDRIVILEDTNGDGTADKQTTFYQGRDIDAAQGICILPTPSGKNICVLVSVGENVFVLSDVDGDDKADSKDVLFSGISGTQHDHGIHAFVLGPDGKLYFNFGNLGKQIKTPDGKLVVDQAGNEVAAHRKPYQEGMVFRCNMDGSEFETLGWNFRNNWEISVDSFGTLWQSDNDDDGNRGVRINYVMEFGNYGYKDEMTGAGWQAERTGMAEDIPTRHWYQNDPGVVPNLLQTGAGSPTGICVYEGDLLPEVFRNQVIHCDAGPNIVRSYPVKDSGAGYEAESVDILHGARDSWFRPSDVCVAPDGSLFVADWYDPSVGGHRMGDVDRGRIFRIAPPGKRYNVPKVDISRPAGAVSALLSPCLSVRYLGWSALHDMGPKAEPALRNVYDDPWMPRNRARALWVLGKIDRLGEKYVELALTDNNPDIRIVGIRLARQLKLDVIPIVQQLVNDQFPKVRRELAIALRHHKSSDAARLWAKLAAQHDGNDRWYLEALGIGADGQWDTFFAAWQEEAGEKWNTAAGRDIIWRSRSAAACDYLARILKDESLPIEQQPRYFRAFDFHKGSEKDAALKSILGL